MAAFGSQGSLSLELRHSQFAAVIPALALALLEGIAPIGPSAIASTLELNLSAPQVTIAGKTEQQHEFSACLGASDGTSDGTCLVLKLFESRAASLKPCSPPFKGGLTEAELCSGVVFPGVGGGAGRSA
jgi:hypothetical protein